jgi:hypothetical protein
LRAFIRKTRVERHVSLLRTPTKRAKLIAQFHDLDLDPRFVNFVPAESQGPATRLYDLRRRLGAPNSCYVMSAVGDLDGREMDLQEALDLTVNHDNGTLISCIPGQLAYYEGDDSCRYILQRRAT